MSCSDWNLVCTDAHDAARASLNGALLDPLKTDICGLDKSGLIDFDPALLTKKVLDCFKAPEVGSRMPWIVIVTAGIDGSHKQHKSAFSETDANTIL